MMQQPVYQQEQAGNQGQQQQQMLLCPVRLVYETQILVQPGDQIRPNQTILINPQNQPPWAQNRVQNQVIYVQNVPNNFMPQVQQHLEQNQMFLQQNYGFPQVIQHPMLTQNQEQIRTLQVGNVSANIQSQMPTNLPQIMPSESMIAHNYGHVQINPGINIQNAAQSQINNVPINTNNRQVQNVPKVTEIPNNTPVSKPLEVAAQNYRQLVNQHLVNQMNIRAQMQPTIAMIQMPNMIQKAQNMEHNQNQQQMNSIQQQVIQVPASNAVQHTYANTSTNVQMEPRKTVPIMQKPAHSMQNTTMNHAPKNQTYTYRPIQPRPQQFRPNVATPAMTVQPNMNIQIQQNHNVTDMNRNAQNVVNTPTNYQKAENSNTQFNRKRKSESPDELRRKLTIVPSSQQASTTNSITVKRIDSPTVPQSVPVKVNTHEIGVNTTPMVKMPPKNRSMIQINPMVDQNMKIKEELAKPIAQTPAPAIIPPVAPAVIHSVAPAVHSVAPTAIQSVAPAVIQSVAPAVISSVAPTITQSVPSAIVQPMAPVISPLAPAVIPPVAPAVIPPVAPAVIPPVAPAVIPPVAPAVIPPVAPAVISPVAPAVISPVAPAVIPPVAPAVIPPVTPAIIPPQPPPIFKKPAPPAPVIPSTAVNIPANIPHNNPLPILNASTQVEKDKLVRNTVFTQARFGRVLSDKDDVPVKINTVPKEPAKVEPEKRKSTNVGMVKTENMPPSLPQVKKEARTEVKEAIPKRSPEVKEEKPVLVERNAEEKMLSDSMHRLKGTEPNEMRFKSERDYILTHVLDGFVIQESNVAFPIRLPLKEKTLAINAEAKKNIKTEETKEAKERVPDLSHLNLTESERLSEDAENQMEVVQEGNPFTDLKHCAVKSWTVDQLAVHLAKFDWADTIAVLQEHEIDGESLFLVSKSQLVSIGVKEEHADVICDFVRH